MAWRNHTCAHGCTHISDRRAQCDHGAAIVYFCFQCVPPFLGFLGFTTPQAMAPSKRWIACCWHRKAPRCLVAGAGHAAKLRPRHRRSFGALEVPRGPQVVRRLQEVIPPMCAAVVWFARAQDSPTTVCEEPQRWPWAFRHAAFPRIPQTELTNSPSLETYLLAFLGHRSAPCRGGIPWAHLCRTTEKMRGWPASLVGWPRAHASRRRPLPWSRRSPHRSSCSRAGRRRGPARSGRPRTRLWCAARCARRRSSCKRTTRRPTCQHTARRAVRS